VDEVEKIAPAGEAVAGETAAQESSDRGRRAMRFARELLETIVLTLIIFLVVRANITMYRVDGTSMVPTLHDGAYLIVNKTVYFHFDKNALRNWLPGPDRQERDVAYLFHPPQRGDIVVLTPPVQSNKPFIKRVIGLPGDRISVHDQKVFVNDIPLDEPYINAPPSYRYPPGSENGSYTVPEGHVFVLGDNRNNSQDSHAPNFGAVSLDSIIGQAFFIYLPLDDAGLIPHHRYSELGE
jgi:signal peptidase I